MIIDSNTPIATQYITAVPLFYWRGARPFPLTLTADDTGAATLLLLSREGDLCLMPINWEQNLPLPFAPPSPLISRRRPRSERNAPHTPRSILSVVIKEHFK